MPLLILYTTVNGQNGNAQTDYANLALQFSSQDFNGDAAIGFFPAAASEEGFGSFVENPASIALISKSYFNFSLANDQNEYQNSFLGNTLSETDKTTQLSNLGFIYKFPTSRGSFVIGGGYNSLINQHRIDQISGRNNQSTITDEFREPDSDYYDIAFNAYATDWGDVDSTYLESIFRIGFAEYPGIDQDAYINYSTDLGEYAFFLGTEVQKDLFLGVSAGVITGTYRYRRDFLETDSQNDYNGNFIPSDINTEGTDVDNILTHDEIDAEIAAFSLRTGLIYRIMPSLNAGLSFTLPSTIVVSESYYSSITTELDDGSTPFESDFASNGEYEYRIEKPGSITAGLAYSGNGTFSAAASVQYIDYTNLRLDLITGNGFGYNTEVQLRNDENALDAFISSNYKAVLNVKTSLGYSVSEALKLKAGYAFLPGKSKIFIADRNIVSGGIRTKLAQKVMLDINGQYSFWNDRSVLYNYYDYSANTPKTEYIDQQVNSFRVIAGVRFLF